MNKLAIYALLAAITLASILPFQAASAADALANYAADRPAVLVRFLQESKAEQFLRMYPTLEAAGVAGIEQLRVALSRSPSESGDGPDRTAARRASSDPRANRCCTALDRG